MKVEKYWLEDYSSLALQPLILVGPLPDPLEILLNLVIRYGQPVIVNRVQKGIQIQVYFLGPPENVDAVGAGIPVLLVPLLVVDLADGPFLVRRSLVLIIILFRVGRFLPSVLDFLRSLVCTFHAQIGTVYLFYEVSILVPLLEFAADVVLP